VTTSEGSKVRTRRDEKDLGKGAARGKKEESRSSKEAARKTRTTGKNEANAEEPAVKKTETDRATTEGEVITRDATEAAEGDEGGEVSRKELVQKALRKIQRQLDSSEDVTPATIGALEKLLKLDRDILGEGEMPQEIRVLWEETDDDPTDQ